MHVLVFEPDHAGHHFAYLKLLLPALAQLTSSVSLVTTAQAVESVEYGSHLATSLAGVAVHSTAEKVKGDPLAVATKGVNSMRDAVRCLKPDHVLVPYADGLTQVLAARALVGSKVFPSGVESEGLLMRGGFAYPANGLVDWAKKRASRAILRHAPWTIVHHLDPIPYEMIQRKGGQLARRSRLMPDPVQRPSPMTHRDARRLLGLPEDGRYAGCVGAMDERKGIDLLIRAFHEAKIGATDRLLLMGPISQGVRSQLKDIIEQLLRSGRLISIDRFVSNDEFKAGIAAMDLVCTPYPKHIGSASIVLHAAAGERPVLGSTFGWIGRTVPQFGLGWTCDVFNTAEFAQSIAQSLEKSRGFQPTLAARRLVEFHSPCNFAAAWTERLRVRLGLPEDTDRRRTWEWVLEAS